LHSSAWRGLAHQRLALAGFLLLLVFVLCALLAPLLAPHDPAQLDLAVRLTPPSAAHWFGTDDSSARAYHLRWPSLWSQFHSP